MKLSALIEEKMQELYSQSTHKDAPRNYIGASVIGSNCLRQIWYEYKGYARNAPSNEIRRTWKLGKLIELMLLELIIELGINIQICDEHGEQFRFIDKELPYFQGNVDAVLIDKVPIILEIKAVKDSSFNVFKKQGFKSWNRRYYDQVQAYMGLSGIHHSIVLMINKDNSSLWDEEVRFNPDYFEQLREKAKKIYTSEIEPERVNNSPAWFECKICQFYKVCHK